MIDVHEQLMGAVVEDNVQEVQRLIENDIDLNSRCDQGASALSGAILHGNLSIIRLMLEHGADPNLVADEPAATIYSEKPLDLALQASFLMDWEKYHPIVKLLESFGLRIAMGEWNPMRIQGLGRSELENGRNEKLSNAIEISI
jgi:hypothetical protein